MDTVIKRVFIFRTADSEKNFIWGELQQGRLRQGWGIQGTQLKEADGTVVDKNVWKQRYKEAAKNIWGENITDQEAERRYWILYPLVEAKEGDIVLVPKMPTWGQFVVARVTAGYSFDFNAQPDDADFRHILMVDPNTLKIFSHYANEQTLTVAGKLRAYRNAVNNVWDEKMKEAIERLLNTGENLKDSKNIDLIFKESLEELLKNILKSVHGYPSEAFENLIKVIFEASGYEFVRSHFYDGSGGDADLVFNLKPPILSEIDSKSIPVYIQVKNKEKIDKKDMDAIEQLTKIAKEPDALKILISSAERFTDECIRKAEENNVTLISGLDVARMLLSRI